MCHHSTRTSLKAAQAWSVHLTLLLLLVCSCSVNGKPYVPAELEAWKKLATQTKQSGWLHCNQPVHFSKPCNCNREEHGELHEGVFVHCVTVGEFRHLQRISLRENRLSGVVNVSFAAFTQLTYVDLSNNTQLEGAGPGGCLDRTRLCKPEFTKESCLLECGLEGCKTQGCEIRPGSPTAPSLAPTAMPSSQQSVTPTSVNGTEIPKSRPGLTLGQTLNGILMLLLLLLPCCGGVLFFLGDRGELVDNADGTQSTRSKWYFTSLGTIDFNDDSHKDANGLNSQTVAVA